jgi:hypothetical protein
MSLLDQQTTPVTNKSTSATFAESTNDSVDHYEPNSQSGEDVANSVYSNVINDGPEPNGNGNDTSEAASRPISLARGHSYAISSNTNTNTTSSLDPFAAERQRRVSYPATSVLHGFSSSTATTPLDEKDIWGSAGRTARAASDGLLLSNGLSSALNAGRAREKSEGDTSATSPLSSGAVSSSLSASQEHQDQAAFFRAHERRSLETSAHTRLANPSSANPSSNTATVSTTSSSVTAELDRDALISPPLPSTGSSHATSFFQQQGRSTSNLPLLSPTLQTAPIYEFKPSSQLTSQQPNPNDSSAPSDAKSPESIAAAARATSASLHLGDLDVWMDEAYVRECCTRMGWDGVTNIKMIRGARSVDACAEAALAQSLTYFV